MSIFLSKKYKDLVAYVPGEQPQDRSYIKLNTNESPFPPSAGVISALNRTEIRKLNFYPDPEARGARIAIANQFGFRPENIVLGNGSDELLAFCFQAFCDSSAPAVYADISYGFYEVYARINCVESRAIPLDESFNIVAKDFYGADGTIFIANPNSPTGGALPFAEVEAIIERNPRNIVVIDEAYVVFGGESVIPLVAKYRNLIVVHTMSKSRNLAGARLGYAVADADLIADINSMKYSFNPYNVNRLSMQAAIAAIKDVDYYKTCVDKIINSRERARSELFRRGFTILPSSANFLFARPNFISGADYYEGLKERGILVRHFNKERIKNFVRISIGADDQMRELLLATDAMIRLYGRAGKN